MTELERTLQLERQLKSATRWLRLALLFIKLACLLLAVAGILLIAGNWRWFPLAIVSFMLPALSHYCKWAAGKPEGGR